MEVECFYCKGELVRSTIPYTISRKGYHLILDTVPAWVCDQCGEPMFDAEDVKSIQRAITYIDEQIAQLSKAA